MRTDDLSAMVRWYLDALVPPRVNELRSMEEHAHHEGFPIIGPACGYLCYLLARLTNARKVFELGSGFGYSTAWFAHAVSQNGGGVVHHVVWDAELSGQARAHLEALNLADLVQFHAAEAVETLMKTEGPFDLIFNDIDKQLYPGALPIIQEKLRPGGLLIVDNMLWGGRIFDDGDHSPETEGVRELTRLVTQDARWVASIVPIRDGLLVARWNGDVAPATERQPSQPKKAAPAKKAAPKKKPAAKKKPARRSTRSK